MEFLNYFCSVSRGELDAIVSYFVFTEDVWEVCIDM